MKENMGNLFFHWLSFIFGKAYILITRGNDENALYITHGKKLYLINELSMALYIILYSSGFIFKLLYLIVEVVYRFKDSISLFLPM